MTDPMTLPVTQWFNRYESSPPDQGVWEVPSDSYGHRYFAYWGPWSGWSVSFETPEQAYRHRKLRAYYPPTLFRGLAINPYPRAKP